MAGRWTYAAAAATGAAISCLAAPPVMAQMVCTSAPYETVEDPALAALLERALPRLHQYPSLSAALSGLAPDICLSDTDSLTHGFFEPGSARVVIAAAADADLQLAILFHEMRHVEQVARGSRPTDALAMADYARAMWALEADATAISLIVAWDMRAEGEPGPWNALAALPPYAPIARGFADAMTAGGDLSRASGLAFELWYADGERRQDYYIASCNAYLERMEEAHALPSYGTLAPGFFETLCVLPDGRRFECIEPDLTD